MKYANVHILATLAVIACTTTAYGMQPLSSSSLTTASNSSSSGNSNTAKASANAGTTTVPSSEGASNAASSDNASRQTYSSYPPKSPFFAVDLEWEINFQMRCAKNGKASITKNQIEKLICDAIKISNFPHELIQYTNKKFSILSHDDKNLILRITCGFLRRQMHFFNLDDAIFDDMQDFIEDVYRLKDDNEYFAGLIANIGTVIQVEKQLKLYAKSLDKA